MALKKPASKSAAPVYQAEGYVKFINNREVTVRGKSTNMYDLVIVTDPADFTIKNSGEFYGLGSSDPAELGIEKGMYLKFSYTEKDGNNGRKFKNIVVNTLDEDEAKKVTVPTYSKSGGNSSASSRGFNEDGMAWGNALTNAVSFVNLALTHKVIKTPKSQDELFELVHAVREDIFRNKDVPNLEAVEEGENVTTQEDDLDE